MSIRKAQRANYRDAGWGAHNPLIRRYFLGVFRFAQMALADVGNQTPE